MTKIKFETALKAIAAHIDQQAEAAKKEKDVATQDAKAADIIVSGYAAGQLGLAAFNAAARVIMSGYETAEAAAAAQDVWSKRIASVAAIAAERIEPEDQEARKRLAGSFRADLRRSCMDVAGIEPVEREPGTSKAKLLANIVGELFRFRGGYDGLQPALLEYADLARLKESGGEMKPADEDAIAQYRFILNRLEQAMAAFQASYPNSDLLG